MAPQGTTSTDSYKFPCKRCSRRFDSLQALGGHQNAHALERAIAKEKRKKLVQHLRDNKAHSELNGAHEHRRAPIGLCGPCMRATPFGAQLSRVIHRAYYQRLKQVMERSMREAGNDTVRQFV